MPRYNWESGFTKPIAATFPEIHSHLSLVFSHTPTPATATISSSNSVLRVALSYKQLQSTSDTRQTMSEARISVLSAGLARMAASERYTHISIWIDQQLSKTIPKSYRNSVGWIALGLEPYYTVRVVYAFGALSDMEMEVKRGWITLEHLAAFSGRGLYLQEPGLTKRPNLWGLNTPQRIAAAEAGVVEKGQALAPHIARFKLAALVVQGVARPGLESFREGDFERIVAWANEVLGRRALPRRILEVVPPGTCSSAWKSASGMQSQGVGLAEWAPWYAHAGSGSLVRSGVMAELCWCMFEDVQGETFAVGVGDVRGGDGGVMHVFLMVLLVRRGERFVCASWKRFYVEEGARLADGIRQEGGIVGKYTAHLVIRGTARTARRDLGSFRHGCEPSVRYKGGRS